MNILLVIDLQKQFKDKNGCYEKCLNFIKQHQKDYYIIGTLFKNYKNSMYVKHLNYKDCMYSNLTDIEYPYNELIIKTGYSANQYDSLSYTITKLLNESCNLSDIQFNIIGCDSDACILSTAFSLWDKNYNFNIFSEYIYTTATDFTNDDVLKILKRNFGSVVV